MSSDLLTTLQTTADRDLLRTELGLLKDALFKTKANSFADTLKREVRASVATVIERELRTQEAQSEKYLTDVLSQMNSIPVLELNIAFQPTQSNIEQFSTQAVTMIGTPVLLKLTVQPEVIGGAVVIWNGHYHDASLKTKFVEKLEKVLHENF